ncbi:hypothetical protein [Bdellovibrio sp. BCCA]|uniref:hypothetical protein n=1 Tax=Bdellovibrio sp. BCCA TaxID=3136281 RepID=UPI0030F1A0AC
MKRKFLVKITETVEYSYHIDAESENEAKEIAEHGDVSPIDRNATSERIEAIPLDESNQ